LEEKKVFLKSKKDIYSLVAVIILAVALVAVLVISLIKPSGVKKKTYFDLYDTVSTVYDYSGGSEKKFESTLRELEELLYYYDALFDIYAPAEGVTNLYDVNREATKAPLKVDAELLDFLEYAIEMHTLTDGEVNIAMGSVLSLWHAARTAAAGSTQNARLPSENELAEAAKHCDITKIIIDRGSSTVFLSDPEMSLDVGALAKGYATERAAELLESKEISGYALDMGGNLRTVGTKPGGDGWRTGVKNPDTLSDTPYVYYLTLKNMSAVTSGDYERYFVSGGVRYHHIIDKDTLMPAGHFSSVTVAIEDSGLADALSTALFCMDYESGKALIESIDGAFAVWVEKDGTVKTAGETPK